MASFDFRPRSNTELLDASVEFVRTHFGILAAPLALAQIPLLAISLAWPPSLSDPFLRLRQQPLLAVALSLAAIWVQAVQSVAFVHIVDDIMHGRVASLASALTRALSRSMSALAMLLVTYIVFILWAMLFLLPMIWAVARYFATFPAFAIEGLGPSAAIRRSKHLAKGHNGRAIALALVPTLVIVVVMALVQQGLLGAGAGYAVTRVVSAVLSIVLYPFALAPGIFLYYDLRTRREGLDLDFGTVPPAAA
jgi:hypothetical protein